MTLPRDDRGTPTYCTYQVLHDKSHFAYVSTHLSVGKYAGDAVRGLQTAAMFRAVDAPYNFFTRKLDPDAADLSVPLDVSVGIGRTWREAGH